MLTVSPMNLRLFMTDAQYRKMSHLKDNLVSNHFSATFGVKEEDGESWWWAKPYAEVFYTHRSVTVRFQAVDYEYTEHIAAVDLELASALEKSELAEKILNYVQDGMEALKNNRPVGSLEKSYYYYYLFFYLLVGLGCMWKNM